MALSLAVCWYCSSVLQHVTYWVGLGSCRLSLLGGLGCSAAGVLPNLGDFEISGETGNRHNGRLGMGVYMAVC